MTFVIGVGKKGIGQHLCCASKQDVDLSYAIKTGQKKKRTSMLISLMNQTIQISLTLTSVTSSRTRRWRTDHLICVVNIQTN